MQKLPLVRSTREKVSEYGKFVLGGIPASGAQVLLTWWLTTHCHMASIEAIILGQVLNSTINFPIQKYLVFKQKNIDTLLVQIFNHIKVSAGWLVVTILSSIYIQEYITHHPLLILGCVAPIKSVLAFLIQRRKVFNIRW